MVQQYLLLALLALALTICLTFAFSDDKEDAYEGRSRSTGSSGQCLLSVLLGLAL
jgi:hypothetical protein